MNRSKKILLLATKVDNFTALDNEVSSNNDVSYPPKQCFENTDGLISIDIENAPIHFDDGTVIQSLPSLTAVCSSSDVNETVLSATNTDIRECSEDQIISNNSHNFASTSNHCSVPVEETPGSDVYSDHETDLEDVNYSSEDSLSKSEEEQVDENSQSEILKKRKRSKKYNVDRNKWKRMENQLKRMKGDAYLGFTKKRNEKWKHDKPRQKRQMKERCNGRHCERTKVYFCDQITEDDRKEIFSRFWEHMNWDQKQIYVINQVKQVEPKRRSAENVQKKSRTYLYYFNIGECSYRVCKKMFLNTLNLGEWSVRAWCTEGSYGITQSNRNKLIQRKINTLNKQNTRSGERKKHLEDWLEMLPKLPSHYARKDTQKKYIEDNTLDSKSQLYRRYVESCVDHKPLSSFVFDEVFDKNNLAIFQPRKDQCDICCAHKVGNMENIEKVYQAHIADKDRSRLEKESDTKKSLEGKCHMVTMDLEAVQLCPRMYASTLYYKQKLRVHNFTMYNVASHQCTNYWWHEGEGKVDASNFVSCIIDYIDTQFMDSKLPIIFYSDGCGYQNRNLTLSNALLRYAVKEGKIIEQKYLTKGHTQMVCDTVHSLIERKLRKREIYLPGEFISITKQARQHPFPLDAKYLHYDFFKNYAEPKYQWYSTIRPGSSKVNDIKALKYTPEGTIYYKTDFDLEYLPLPARKNKMFDLLRTEITYSDLYTEQPAISLEKYEHLMAITEVLDSDFHSFYKNLHHEKNRKKVNSNAQQT